MRPWLPLAQNNRVKQIAKTKKRKKRQETRKETERRSRSGAKMNLTMMQRIPCAGSAPA